MEYKKLKNVDAFQASESYLVYAINNTVEIQSSSEKQTYSLPILKGKINNFLVSDGAVYAHTSSGESFILKHGSSSVFGHEQYGNAPIGNSILICNYNYDRMKVEFNLCNNFPIWKESIAGDVAHIVDDSLYIISCPSEIRRINTPNGHVVWRMLLKVNPFKDAIGRDIVEKIERIIEITKERIGVVLNSGIIRVLNTEIGNQEKEIGIENPNINNKLVLGVYTQTDKRNQRLLGLRYNWFWEIEIESGEYNCQVFDISGEVAKHDFQPDGTQIEWDTDENGNLICCDTRKGKVARFDPFSRQFSSVTDIEVKDEGINKINKVTFKNNSLFVHDRENTLHIYKNY